MRKTFATTSHRDVQLQLRLHNSVDRIAARMHPWNTPQSAQLCGHMGDQGAKKMLSAMANTLVRTFG